MDITYRDGTYDSANPTWHVEDSPWKARQIETILRRNDIPANTVCEVGCGAGEILVQLQRTFPSSQFFGYDISPQAFSLSQSRANARLQFHLKDLLAEQNAHFDVVLAIDVFEHIEDYLDFLKRLRARGTFKVFHVPLDLSVQSLLRVAPILRDRKSVGHLHYFFKETAIETLQDCGYEIIDYLYTPRRLELPDLPLSAQLLKFPRQLLFGINADFAVRTLGKYSLLVLAR
jgi:hypothetical protein